MFKVAREAVFRLGTRGSRLRLDLKPRDEGTRHLRLCPQAGEVPSVQIPNGECWCEKTSCFSNYGKITNFFKNEERNLSRKKHGNHYSSSTRSKNGNICPIQFTNFVGHA